MRPLPIDFQPAKVLLRLPNWLGDLVMASGVIDQVRALWPHARLDLLAQPSLLQLFSTDPRLEKCWPWKAKGWSKYNPFHPLIGELRSQEYDLGILLTNSFSSAWQMRWMGIGERVGFAGQYRSALLTRAPQFPLKRHKQHLVITYQQLLAQVVPKAKDSATWPPKIYLKESQVESAKQWLASHIPAAARASVVGLNPSAAYGPAKQWPYERFKELARRLVARGFAVLVFGEPSSKELGESITQGLTSHGLCHNLAGQTSMEAFIGLMSQCQGLVTNDSGPMHIAAALNLPLVAIFGSTDDVTTGPYGSGCVIHKHVECSPCFKRVCPIDFRCMMRVGVDEVEAALLEQIASSRLEIRGSK